MTELNSFETRLLAELRAVVKEDKRPSTPMPVRQRRQRGPWAIATAAAAVVAGALILVPTLHTDPAWAVSRSGNGRVEVQVNRIEDADGLERALAAEGIAADVTYVPNGRQCAPGRYTALDTPGGLLVSTGSDRSFHVTVPPGAVPDGGVLVLAASFVPLPDVQHNNGARETNRFRVWVEAGVATGPVTPCVVVPAQG